MILLRAAFIIGLSFACVSDAISQPKDAEQAKAPTISASIRAERSTVKTGARVIVSATLTNRSDHKITFGYDRNQGVFDVDVFDENGALAPDRRAGYHNGRFDLQQLTQTETPEQVIKSGVLTGHMVWATLKPSETLVENIDVSKYYEMTKPATYKIVIQRPDPDTKSIVKSNVIEVTVSKSG